MKMGILTASLLIGTALTASFASATSMIARQSATFTKMQLDPRFPNADGYGGGMIELDYVSKKVTLTLFPRAKNPTEVADEVALPAPTQIVMELKSREYDHECNVVAYTAEDDDRPRDGLLTKAIIVNQSQSTCMGGEPGQTPDTMITLETRSPGFRLPELVTHSSLEATQLQ